MKLGENPTPLLECLHLEALGVRVSLWDSLVTPPPRRLGAARIVEQRVVIVSSSDRGDCEGFLTFPRRRAKRYSSGLLVACVDPHLVLVVQHPIEGLACEAN